MMWWMMSLALAGELPWAGDWVLDPTQSDDGPEQIDRLVRAPVTSSGRQAAGYSPDPSSGQSVVADDRQRLINALNELMSRSGQIGLAEAGDGIEVTYAGEDAITVPFGRKWTKVEQDGARLRIRAQRGSTLTLERRTGGAIMVETFLPIREPGEVAVVVRIDGSGVDPREFRRVYRDVTTP